MVELPSSVIGRLLMLSCSETRGADWEDSARVCEARFEDFQPKLKEPPEPQFASMQAGQRVVTMTFHAFKETVKHARSTNDPLRRY